MMRTIDVCLVAKRLMVLVCAGVIGLASPVWAQGGATNAQVEQLQKQLAAMQEEMKALQKALEAKDVPADARATMQGHMQRMDQQWQMMHHDCCMMNPAGCQHMGMGMGMPSQNP